MATPQKIKAYQVTTDDSEVSVLVWAATPGQAKSMAMCDLWIDGSEWNKMLCKRVPQADDHKSEPYLAGLTYASEDDLRLMRRLGWYEVEGSSETCSVCDLFEWEALPESRIYRDSLDDDQGICKECRDKKQIGTI